MELLLQGLEAWVESHDMDSVVGAVNSVIDQCRLQYGLHALSVVGFCWGGAVAQELACTDVLPSSGPPSSVCIVHGCYMKMHVNGHRLKRTAAYFCGGDDAATPHHKRQVVLQTFEKANNPLNRMYVYKDQRHFFAVPRPKHRHCRPVLQAAQHCLDDVIAYIAESTASTPRSAAVKRKRSHDGGDSDAAVGAAVSTGSSATGRTTGTSVTASAVATGADIGGGIAETGDSRAAVRRRVA